MAKKTPETTFGTRIQNEQNLVTILQNTANYKAYRPEDAIEQLQELIKTIQISNSNEANLLQTYTLAVDARQKNFEGDDNSIKALTTHIIATLRAQYGKEAKETTSLIELIKKIRGDAPHKSKTNPDDKSISTSQQSYASLTQNFADLIASLEVLKPPYAPNNPHIVLAQLEQKLESIRETTYAVVNAFNGLDKERKNRNTLYADLKVRTQRVKENIKAQYGVKSAEYASIKGLTI